MGVHVGVAVDVKGGRKLKNQSYRQASFAAVRLSSRRSKATRQRALRVWCVCRCEKSFHWPRLEHVGGYGFVHKVKTQKHTQQSPFFVHKSQGHLDGVSVSRTSPMPGSLTASCTPMVGQTTLLQIYLKTPILWSTIRV